MALNAQLPRWNVKDETVGLAKYVYRDEVRAHLGIENSPVPPLDKLKEIYEELSARPINYVNAGLNSEDGRQEIRSPRRVLGNQQLAVPGNGTCLDLSLVFAAACLAADIPTVVVIVERPGESLHALVLAWIGDPDSYPLAEQTYLQTPDGVAVELIKDLEAAGPLPWIAIDTVGVCFPLANSDVNGLGADFSQAVHNGSTYLASGGGSNWNQAVNLQRAWDPTDVIGLPEHVETLGPQQMTPTDLVGAVGRPDRRRPATQTNTRRLVGRDRQMTRLRELLASNEKVIALHGMAGTGKSALAVEFAHLYSNQYSLIWWINADNISGSYDRLASRLGIAADKPEDRDRLVTNHLQQRQNWIAIIDNVTDRDHLEEIRPQVDTGQAIITSRSDNWPAATSIAIGQLAADDAQAWIIEASPTTADEDVAAASELVAELGALALALSIATGYMQRSNKTAQYYLENFRRRGPDLLNKQRLTPEDYEHTVYAAFAMSLDALAAADKQLAVAIIEIISFYAPDRIPLYLFTGEPLAADPIDLDDAIEDLRAYSLIQLDGDYISVHRLVQQVTRQHMLANEEAQVGAVE